MANHHQHRHFLVAALDAHGHINPARILSRRLTSSAPGTRVTLAIPTTAFRRMFPSTDEVEEDGNLISFSHFSDGREDGLASPADLPEIELRSKANLSRLVLDLAGRGRPVTVIIYALLMTTAIDVARELCIPSVLFWIQPAAVFAIYHHYFHGYAGFIDAHKSDPSHPVELPAGLPPLTIADLPSFLSTARSDGGSPLSYIYFMFEDMFRTLDREPSTLTVLVNTFEDLEAGVLSSDIDGVEMIPVGPMVSVDERTTTLKEDEQYYMEWLDSKDEGSVVYLFFGSITSLSPRQMEEISRGLRASGRPFLWALKQKNIVEGGEMGMVVEWCSQARVLAHRSVGCFVTHCGWNSTLESLMCGVPMVMMPQWTEQVTTASLVEGEWGVGVRAEVSDEIKEEKLVGGRELRRCVDLVMGDGERGTEIRGKAAAWRGKAREAEGKGGSSSRNISAFIGKF